MSKQRLHGKELALPTSEAALEARSRMQRVSTEVAEKGTGQSSGTYQQRVLALYEAQKSMIHGYVCRRVRPDDVEDVLQDILHAIVERFDSFRGKSSEKTWVYSVCRFSVFKYYARVNRQSGERNAVGPERIEEPQESPLDRLVVDEERLEVRRLLDRLRPIDREILELRFVEELSYAEIAEVIGLGSDEACRSRCRRALLMVQRALRRNPVLASERPLDRE